MPRRARSIQGGFVYHILNRANARMPIFRKEADHAAFERVLEEAHAREAPRILAYCVMPNGELGWGTGVRPGELGSGRH